MINKKRVFTFFFLFGLTLFGPICAEGIPIELYNKSTDPDSGKTFDNGKDSAAIVTEVPDTRKVDIKATAVRASLNPQFQFVLPTGNISEHFIIYFNILQMTFDLAYSIIDSSLEGEVMFSYPIKKFTPFVSFNQKVDFENLIQPGLKDSELTLIPAEKYISRNRGSVIGIGYKPLPTFTIEPSFAIEDVFKGNITKSTVIDEGINLRPGISFIFDNFQAELPDGKLYTRGIYFNSNFTMLYRNNFENPVNVKNHNLFLFHYYDDEKAWFLKERVSLNYPIKVWEKEINGFYSLGGFDTIRGYSFSSINAFSFFLISSEVEREILKEREVKIKIKKFEARIHQYRVFFLFDTLFTQDRLGIESDVNCFPAIGFGTGFNLSGKSNTHFRVRLYTAQAVGRKFAPLIYFRTSLFNFETKN